MSTEREPTAGRELQSAGERGAEEDALQRREHVQTELRRLDRLARLLDDQFRIPFTDRRVGLDPIIGILPGGGDWVAWLAGVYILWMAARLGAPPDMLVRMAAYLGIDLLGGYIPVAGDLFDAAYKSNRKNVDLLLEHFDYHPERGSTDDLPAELPSSAPSPWKTYALALGLIVLLGLLAAGPVVLLWWLFSG